MLNTKNHHTPDLRLATDEPTPYPGFEVWAHMSNRTALHTPRALAGCLEIRLLETRAGLNTEQNSRAAAITFDLRLF